MLDFFKRNRYRILRFFIVISMFIASLQWPRVLFPALIMSIVYMVVTSERIKPDKTKKLD